MSERPVESTAGPGPVRARCERPSDESTTVRVVDDDPAVQRGFSRILLRAGFSVVGARTLDEALGRAGPGSGPLNLVVSDLILPGADAGDLVRRRGDQRPGLPVLFVPGQAPEDVRLSPPYLTGQSVLQKPIPPPLLLLANRQLLHAVREADRHVPAKAG